MASNRLSYVFRAQLRLGSLRSRVQGFRKVLGHFRPLSSLTRHARLIDRTLDYVMGTLEPSPHDIKKRNEFSTLNGCRKCFRRLMVPVMTGNAVYAFSIPGFSWGKKEEKVDEKKEVLDTMQQILNEADRLYSENEALALYDLLIQYKDMENDEVLWRLARAAVDKGKLSKDEKQKKALYYEAYDYILRAIDLNKQNFAVHKWYAILLDYIGEIEGTKQRLTNSIKVKEHFLKAVELNPKDATSIHSLGQWCFTFADMPWYQRRVASVIYASPPSSTYEEALEYFLKAEETEPNFYSMNLLMLGKTYMKLRNAEMAYTYLVRCKNYPVKTPDDEKANQDAIQLLNMLGQKRVEK